MTNPHQAAFWRKEIMATSSTILNVAMIRDLAKIREKTEVARLLNKPFDLKWICMSCVTFYKVK